MAAAEETPAGIYASSTVYLGEEAVTFPGERLQPLDDSSDLLKSGNFVELRKHLERDGLLFLPGTIAPEKVMAARSAVLKGMADAGGILDPSADWNEAKLNKDCSIGCVPFMEGGDQLPSVIDVAECDELRILFSGLFEEVPMTLDYKWLRAVPHGRFTGAHMDSVYMCRGSPRLLTCWIPIGDTPLTMGGLALMPGSHTAGSLRRVRETYGALDFEADGVKGSGWLTEDAADAERLVEGACVWKAADYRAGDVVVFGMHTLHMSTANRTDRARLSMDVRWQPASHAPDPRYMGPAANPKLRVRAGIFGASDARGSDSKSLGVDSAGGDAQHPGQAADAGRTVAELRSEWGY